MKTAFTVIVAALVAFPSYARELEGVSMPDKVTSAGQEMELKGMGLRTKFFMNVYVAGLYLQDPTKDALSGQAKQVSLVLLRDLSKDKIADAIRDGFEKNSRAEMPKLEERLDKLIGVLTDSRKGDAIILTYVPGTGTTVTAKGKSLTVIEGDDFAKALFSVWLGRDPVDDGLKTAMLGKK